MDSTESPVERLIASMVAALEGSSAQLTYLRALTTMYGPVTPYTPNIMRYCKEVLLPAAELRYTSQTNPASSALTSSNTLRSAASSLLTGEINRKEEPLSKENEKPTEPNPMPSREPRPRVDWGYGK